MADAEAGGEDGEEEEEKADADEAAGSRDVDNGDGEARHGDGGSAAKRSVAWAATREAPPSAAAAMRPRRLATPSARRQRHPQTSIKNGVDTAASLADQTARIENRKVLGGPN